jgi:hypothetical protein
VHDNIKTIHNVLRIQVHDNIKKYTIC